MNVDLTMYEPAELRLIAKFVGDLADIREKRTAELMDRFPCYGTVAAAQETADKTEEAPAAAEEKPAKRTRKAKEEPAAEQKTEEPAGSTPSETPAPAEEPKTEAAQSDTPKVTHDDLRILFGNLSQSGKRNDGIAVFRARGYNGVAAVKEDDLGAVYAELKKLETDHVEA